MYPVRRGPARRRPTDRSRRRAPRRRRRRPGGSPAVPPPVTVRLNRLLRSSSPVGGRSTGRTLGPSTSTSPSRSPIASCPRGRRRSGSSRGHRGFAHVGRRGSDGAAAGSAACAARWRGAPRRSTPRASGSGARCCSRRRRSPPRRARIAGTGGWPRGTPRCLPRCGRRRSSRRTHRSARRRTSGSGHAWPRRRPGPPASRTPAPPYTWSATVA